MKRFHLLLTIFTSVLVFSSCTKEPPAAQFSTEKSIFKMGEVISFANQSVNAKSFLWDFADGNTSTLENPTHAYAIAGDFAVKLTVTGSGGTDSISSPITILPDLSGLWLQTVTYGSGGGFNNKQTGTMNITQHDDFSLTGSFVYNEGSRTAVFISSSKIEGNAVSIDWASPANKFRGTVSAAGNSMSGTFSSQNASGTWSATKL